MSGYIVTIQNNLNKHYRESRIYSTLDMAKAYLKDQALIHDVPWNGENTLIAGNNTITILEKGLAIPKRQKYDREPCSCILM